VMDMKSHVSSRVKSGDQMGTFSQTSDECSPLDSLGSMETTWGVIGTGNRHQMTDI
jgi:hypothetical protein